MRRPREIDIQELAAYLAKLEGFLDAEERDENSSAQLELQAEVDSLQEEIEKAQLRSQDLPSEEREAVDLEALGRWEDSWMAGDGLPSDYYINDDYYDSLEYELYIAQSHLQSLADIGFLFDFRYLFRSSFFVHLYSFIEGRLNQTCDWVAYHNGIPVSVHDLRFNGIKRARTYLLRVKVIDLSQMAAWIDLVNYNKLRNCIVHARGFPCVGSHLRDTYIRRSDVALCIDRQGRIVFERAFCEGVLATIRSFFQELDAAV